MRTDASVSELLFGSTGASLRGNRLPLFFMSPDLERMLEELLMVTEQSRSIPLIKAPKGAGKSTLAYQFLHAMPDSWLPCRIDANPLMHPEQLLSLLSINYGVREESDQITDDLLERLCELRERGNLPVVVIDDAHLLPTSTIVALLRLHERANSQEGLALRILLFARDTIDELLRTPPVQAMNLQVLRPISGLTFDRVQTERFIRHVLSSSGQSGRLPLNQSRVDTIYRESFGLPGRIEEATVIALADGDLYAPRGSTSGWLKLVGGTLLVCAIGVGGWLLFDQPPPPPPLAQVPAQKLPHAEPAAPSAPPAIAQPPHKEAPRPVSLPAPPPSLVPPAAPPPISKPAPAAPVTELPGTPPPAPAQATPPPVASAPPATPAPVESPPAPEPPPAASQPPLVDPNTVVWKKEEWLLAQSPQNYTIQVAALGSVEAIRRFAARYPLDGTLAWFPASRNGRPWYAVLYGSYPNHAAATAALRTLAPAIRDGGAWVRSMASVQEEIRQVEKAR